MLIYEYCKSRENHFAILKHYLTLLRNVLLKDGFSILTKIEMKMQFIIFYGIHYFFSLSGMKSFQSCETVFILINMHLPSLWSYL